LRLFHPKAGELVEYLLANVRGGSAEEEECQDDGKVDIVPVFIRIVPLESEGIEFFISCVSNAQEILDYLDKLSLTFVDLINFVVVLDMPNDLSP
jgi:hypothetical protein